MNVLLGVTGGIAAYKSCEIVRRLREEGHEVTVVMTEAAQRFVTPLTFATLSGRKVGARMFDEGSPDPEIDHIRLARWPQLVLIAPATAQYMRRIGTPGVEIGGIEIPEGTNVVCWIASANRDEKRWGPTADKPDITRPDAPKHVAFGKGPHVCIGSWLARLELEIVVGTILKRFPNTELPDQELIWSSNVIRGPEEVVLELKP